MTCPGATGSDVTRFVLDLGWERSPDEERDQPGHAVAAGETVALCGQAVTAQGGRFEPTVLEEHATPPCPRCLDLIRQVVDARASDRRTIGVAIGVVRERQQLDEVAALAVLTRAAAAGGCSLREVAVELAGTRPAPDDLTPG